MPWAPKIREDEVEMFLNAERMKFFDYRLAGDAYTVFGLPRPIHEAVASLRKHVYVSLGERQVNWTHA